VTTPACFINLLLFTAITLKGILLIINFQIQMGLYCK